MRIYPVFSQQFCQLRALVQFAIFSWRFCATVFTLTLAAIVFWRWFVSRSVDSKLILLKTVVCEATMTNETGVFIYFSTYLKYYTPRPVVPKLGVNYPPGVICDSSRGNAKSKSHCCSVLWAITAIEIFNLKCKKFLLRVIRRNRYLDLGNGSTKFGNHWPRPCNHTDG